MKIIEKINSKFSTNIPIHIVVINGCMADETKLVEEGVILDTIKKKIYGSTEDIEFYQCEFPSGIKELAISRCYKREETGIISYWT